MEMFCSFRGRVINAIRVSVKARIGAIKKIFLLVLPGTNSSLVKSLIASLKGCSTPAALVLFGPLRSCLYPKILRSSKVMKATLNKTGIRRRRKFTEDIPLKENVHRVSHTYCFKAMLYLSYVNRIRSTKLTVS